MDNQYGRLLAEVDVAIALLAEHGHEHWVCWLEEDRTRLRRGDSRGLSHLRGAFGGMGSLWDVRLESADDEASLRHALSEIYAALRELQATEGAEPGPEAHPCGTAAPSAGGRDRSPGKPRAVRAWRNERRTILQRVLGPVYGFDVLWEDGAVDHDVHLNRILEGARLPADYWTVHEAACRSAPEKGPGPWVTYPYGDLLGIEDTP